MACIPVPEYELTSAPFNHNLSQINCSCGNINPELIEKPALIALPNHNGLLQDPSFSELILAQQNKPKKIGFNFNENSAKINTAKQYEAAKRRSLLELRRQRRANNNNNMDKKKKLFIEKSQTDFIHVRARPGQATDSHSLAERARREKISERMKCLQELVPGCDQVTGKAMILDEIINYVQTLQQRVQFLCMKVASIYPYVDLSFDNLILPEEKEVADCLPIESSLYAETNLSHGVALSGRGLDTMENLISSYL